MKKILLTSLFIFGLFLSGTSVNAIGGEVHLVGKDGVVTNQLQYTKTLRRGAYGPSVLALQKKLRDMGYYHKALDSDYGSGTVAAVKQFQRANDLRADGIAGPYTFTKILGTSVANYSTLNVGATKPSVCTLEYSPMCGIKRCVSKECSSSDELGFFSGRHLFKTFSNKCILEKAGYQFAYKGECKTETVEDDNVVSECTKEYAPVCTIITNNLETFVSSDARLQTFSNKCLAKKVGAKFLYEGKCKTDVKPTEELLREIGDELIEKLIEKLELKIERLENEIEEIEKKIEDLKSKL